MHKQAYALADTYVCTINTYITYSLHMHATQTYQHYPKTCRRTEISWIPHLNTNASIIMLNVNPLNMKQQRHWIVEAIWSSDINVTVLFWQLHFPGSWKEVLLGSEVWLTAGWYFRIQELQFVPQFGYTLVSCRTHWCVMGFTAVFWNLNLLVCSRTHWCVPGLSDVT